MNKRQGIVATACVAGAAVLVSGGVFLAAVSEPSANAETTSGSIKTATADVVKGDLQGTTTKPGQLSRVAGSVIPGGPSGTLTEIPAVGATIRPGDVLYRVDNAPVVYFAGVLPQWRAFEEGMADGPDVRQLEENLHAWGYLDQVATDKFDWYTTVAIKKWQKATGQEKTGVIDSGRIHFGQGEQIVSDRKAVVGSQVGPGGPIFTTTGIEKVVTVDLPIGSPLAKVGGEVRVKPPVGGQTPGRIRSIGDPVTDDDGSVTVPVTIVLTSPAAVKDLDNVDVSVDFVSDTRTDVLSVPVTALGAKAGGGFVVQVVGKAGVKKDVAIEVGLFAGDRVEVVSGSVAVGDRVVVPA